MPVVVCLFCDFCASPGPVNVQWKEVKEHEKKEHPQGSNPILCPECQSEKVGKSGIKSFVCYECFYSWNVPLSAKEGDEVQNPGEEYNV